MVESGEIRDAKTIMLLQYAVLNIFPPTRAGLAASRRRPDGFHD
jgi:hypothetical protein